LLEGIHRPRRHPGLATHFLALHGPVHCSGRYMIFRGDIVDGSFRDRSGFRASGLLDAWVTPDGRILKADDLDSALVVGKESSIPDDKILAQALYDPFPTVEHYREPLVTQAG
jgi:hypothetical protein